MIRSSVRLQMRATVMSSPVMIPASQRSHCAWSRISISHRPQFEHLTCLRCCGLSDGANLSNHAGLRMSAH